MDKKLKEFIEMVEINDDISITKWINYKTYHKILDSIDFDDEVLFQQAFIKMLERHHNRISNNDIQYLNMIRTITQYEVSNFQRLYIYMYMVDQYESFKLLLSIDSNINQGDYYNIQGKIAGKELNYQLAIEMFDKAIEIYEKNVSEMNPYEYIYLAIAYYQKIISQNSLKVLIKEEDLQKTYDLVSYIKRHFPNRYEYMFVYIADLKVENSMKYKNFDEADLINDELISAIEPLYKKNQKFYTLRYSIALSRKAEIYEEIDELTAIEYYDKAIKIRNEAIEKYHVDFERLNAWDILNTARLLKKSIDDQDSFNMCISSFRDALDIFVKYNHINGSDFTMNIYKTYREIGDLFNDYSMYEDAITEYLMALDAVMNEEETYGKEIMYINSKLGNCQMKTGAYEDAKSSFTAALNYLVPTYEKNSSLFPEVIGDTVENLMDLAIIFESKEEARVQMINADFFYERLLEKDFTYYERALARVHYHYGHFIRNDDAKEALTHLSKSLVYYQKAFKANPIDFISDYQIILDDLVYISDTRLNQHEKAVEFLFNAIKVFESTNERADEVEVVYQKYLLGIVLLLLEANLDSYALDYFKKVKYTLLNDELKCVYFANHIIIMIHLNQINDILEHNDIDHMIEGFYDIKKPSNLLTYSMLTALVEMNKTRDESLIWTVYHAETAIDVMTDLLLDDYTQKKPIYHLAFKMLKIYNETNELSFDLDLLEI